MSGDYKDYKHVDAKTIYDAVNGDNEAFMVIFYRYQGYLRTLLINAYGKAGIKPKNVPIEDVVNASWMEMKKCVMKFRPR